jgi:dTDP-4-dehydrorhamnose reductase
MGAARPDLVLGGSGFLGAHLVGALLGRGRTVVSASRRPAAPTGAALPTEVWSLDGAQPGAGAAEIAGGRFERVFLAAALARVGDAARDPGLALRLNRDWPAELAAACAVGGTRLVFVSTDLVFGAEPPPGPAGFREQDAPAPLEPYGASKAAGEATVLKALPGALVARLPLLYGESFGRGLGALDALLGALERGEPVALFTDEHRTPADVAVAADELVRLEATGAAGTWHLGGPERLSRAELGARLLARHDPERRLPRPTHTTRAAVGLAGTRAADAGLDSARARALLAGPDTVQGARG